MITVKEIADFLERVESTTQDRFTAKVIRTFLTKHKLWSKHSEEKDSEQSNPKNEQHE